MIDFIKAEFKKIDYKCIERESKKANIDINSTRLSMYLNDDATNGYRIIEEFEKGGIRDVRVVKEMNFMEVLDVLIDFKMYSQIAPPFIQKGLLEQADALSIKFNDISAVCYPTYKKGDIAICIFNKKTFVKQVTIAEFLNDATKE